MDVQPRAPQHGARWHHAINETGDGRIVPLLAVVKSGRITGLYAGLLLPWKRGGRGGVSVFIICSAVLRWLNVVSPRLHHWSALIQQVGSMICRLNLIFNGVS